MTMNRVQFQPGLSMPEFFERYGTEAQVRGGAGGGALAHGLRLPGLRRRGAHQLRARRAAATGSAAPAAHQCSLISGTIFESSKLALTRWFLAMHLLTQSKNNVSALELMRQLGVSYRSAWLMKHKIMEAMRVREDARELDGRVEIDDAYLGGERSGGKAGRGSENKVPFVAAVQTTPSGQPAVACLRQQPPLPRKRWRCSPPATSPLRPPSSPTGCGASAPQPSSAPSMSAIVTGGGKASVKLPQFKAINTLAGQPEDRHQRHLPRLRLRQVRPSLPRRVPVPLQPPLQHEDHPVSLAHRPGARPAVVRAGAARC